ncbi:hypothetical protein WJX77_007452 [Trebouxia sp. C0004]
MTQRRLSASWAVDRAAKPFRTLESIMQEEQAAAAPAAGATVNDSAPQNAEADEGQPIELPEGAEDDLVEQIESAIVTPNEPMDLTAGKHCCEKARVITHSDSPARSANKQHKGDMTSFVLQGNQKRKSASCTAFWLVLVLCRLEGQGMSMQEMYPLLTLIAVRLLSLCNFLRS